MDGILYLALWRVSAQLVERNETVRVEQGEGRALQRRFHRDLRLEVSRAGAMQQQYGP